MLRRASEVFEDRGPKDWTYPGSQRGRITLRRFEQGRLAASQILFNGLRMMVR